jgi:putative radical SAM enzyme (TIGR03279 family)
MKSIGLRIYKVELGSIAEQMGLETGDRITAINGDPVRDIIDFRYLEADEILSVDIKKTGGEEWILEVEKDFDQDLGIDFGSGGFGPTIRCTNKCVFCFVDQMPPGMRKTLYVKDDDYRLSFWSGNFITLTNLGKNQLKRIASQRLSPLFISVHTTNPALREKMLGSGRAGLIMEQLRYLAEAGIEMHTQAVLCPGLNDKKELERTVSDLASLWPAVRSLAVVPVGLTRFRENLYSLDPFTRKKARELVSWVHTRQDEYIDTFKHPFIFASDEFYLLAGESIPGAERYDGFPQVENGVGLTRLFVDEWAEAERGLPRQIAKQKIVLLTGLLGKNILKPVAAGLNKIKGLKVKVKAVENNFFGNQVTAAGLVTGSDILAQVQPGECGDLMLLPSVMIKAGEAIFLDNLSLEELAEKLKARVAVVAGPRQLADVLINGPQKAQIFTDKSS